MIDKFDKRQVPTSLPGCVGESRVISKGAITEAQPIRHSVAIIHSLTLSGACGEIPKSEPVFGAAGFACVLVQGIAVGRSETRRKVVDQIRTVKGSFPLNLSATKETSRQCWSTDGLRGRLPPCTLTHIGGQRLSAFWLGDRDLNPDQMIQSATCPVKGRAPMLWSRCCPDLRFMAPNKRQFGPQLGAFQMSHGAKDHLTGTIDWGAMRTLGVDTDPKDLARQLLIAPKAEYGYARKSWITDVPFRPTLPFLLFFLQQSSTTLIGCFVLS